MAESSTESVARRKAPRLEIRLPVELEHGRGWTRDVSASGVYFETTMPFAPGAPISFSLVMTHASPAVLRLQCEGQVVRVDRDKGRIGVAAAIKSSQLVHGSEGKLRPVPVGRPRSSLRLADQAPA